MLARGQMAAGKRQDFGIWHSFASGRDLAVLVGVFVAASDVEGDGTSEIASDGCEIPASRVVPMFGNEACSIVEERCSVPSGDGRAELSELL